MNAEERDQDELWAAYEAAEPTSGDRGAGHRRRRLRGAARPAAGARPHPEGRPDAHLDPGAGRAVSRLCRAGAQPEAGARRRLSGDGGVAGLSQVAPAAAAGRRRRGADRRGDGRRTGLPPAPAGGHARGGQPAGQPQPAGARRLRPRRPGADRDHQARRVHRHALRPAHRLCRDAPAQRRLSRRISSASARSGRCRTRATRSPA